MHRVELVTHCWAKQLEQYARHLQFQLSSIDLYARRLPVMVTVCYSTTDHATSEVVRHFRRSSPAHINPLALPESSLFRRAIGRNIAAKRTTADLVWFTDVDYFFGPGALKALCSYPREQWQPLMQPRHVWRQKDWETGDWVVEQVSKFRDTWGLVPLPEQSLFEQTREGICIGGLMIVSGDEAREHGFLDGTKWVKPVDSKRGFLRCHCDTAWRQHRGFGRRGHKIDIPQVYRIRHTLNGRDYRNADVQ